MPSTFEEALKRTVFGMSEAYLAAEQDLAEETAAASDAVFNVTETVRLFLRRMQEDTEGTVFELRLVNDRAAAGAGGDLVGAFFIPLKGYPINAAVSTVSLTRGPGGTELPDRQSIKEYFNQMASNPDSPLALRVALTLRRKSAAQKQTIK